MVVLQVIGLVLLGAGVIIGGVVGLAVLIAKSAGHDQATCDCWDCQGRRVRAVKKATEKRTPQDRINSHGWLTTRELRIEMILSHKGNRYQISDLANTDYGKVVSLSHIPTRRRSVVPVSRDMLDRRMWQIENPRNR